MNQLLICLLTLLFSLSGPAMGEYSDFGRWSIAAKGTEVVQRAMSRGELEAIQNSGLLSRGGRAGDHFVSDAVNSAAGRARQRLALPGTPGGGMERTAPGGVDIPARVFDVLKY